MTTAPPTPIVAALDAHARRLASVHLRNLLCDAARPGRLALEAGPLHADFSRQRLDEAVLADLAAWASDCGFERRREDLFAGRVVNPTEGRPALHTALRGVGGDPAVASAVAAQLHRMDALATRLRDGGLPGFRGTPVRALVCIGIGGSDLGPRLVHDALREPGGFDVRFVANVDPDDLARELVGLDAATTAFAIVSKTFTTRETLANGLAARGWLAAGGCPPEATSGQLIGVTAAPEAARSWGIRPGLLLEFWDWVGGRYSLWSTVGLGIAVGCGPAAFAALRGGAATVDRHFRDAPLASNLPARVGLVSVWNRAFLGLPSQALIPYSERLRLLPAWAQQLVMESNGKSATLSGGRIERPTSPVVWGASGTNAQHSFFQQLHQGPDVVPVDFVVARASHTPSAYDGDDRHRILVANCVAQAAALALGREPTDGDGHRAFPGNRPSTLFTLPRIDAGSLGALLACWEHATFTAATVLGINPFDQFGVEYGKVMATSVESLLAGSDIDGIDPATRASVARLR
ncbi:MAG: glucose-6-phosphate isomerase [Burkholderiaceae bacterium]|jgi:glucose-6-phosphate isomerase|nr:glucose-6-phosphate isomerase [Burkholderiales bacterium]MCZ8340158.1 glucose-6-phosphate isomerase [Burkholderiaceae bacterium]